MDTPNPAQPQPVTAPDEPATPAGFLVRNGVTLLMVAAFAALVVVFLGRVEDSTEKLLNILKVAVGLGLVIFIHELGHFAAAKLCDVHVETFSIGFGPPFLGICAFKWGETTYKLAWFPLGGYVKMLGEGDEAEGAEEDPRSFKNKSVWQRMVIISAGVAMNILLAVLLFIVVYMTHGIHRRPGVVGHVEPGLAAWKHGLTPGSMIRRVGRVNEPYYEELQREVNGGRMDRPITVEYETFGGAGTRAEKQILPTPVEEIPLPMLGIASAPIPVVISADRGEKQPFVPDSAAARAAPALQFGDRIVGATDPDNPSQVTPLAADPRRPGEDQRDFFDLRRRLQRTIGQPITLRVERDGGPVDVRVPPAFANSIGLRMSMGPVVAIRQGSPADGKVRPKAGDEASDKLTAVEVTRPDGSTQRWSATPGDGGDPLDPVRLPTQLALWAMSRPSDWTVRLTVQRPEGHKGAVPTPLTLTWDKDWDPLDEPPATYASSPLSLSGLGIAFQVLTTIDAIEKGSPADGTALKPGDVIQKMELTVVTAKGKTDTVTRELKDDRGAHYFWFLTDGHIREVTLTVNQGEKVALTPREDRTWPLVDRGLRLEPDSRVQKAGNIGEALVMGFRRLLDQMASIYETLFALVTGQMSAKAISGPISIAVVSYSLAGRDVWELILFLALININLAVVNFLPIPVLDGGHMVFLIYEKLRGKPPSDRVRFIATIIGLVMVLGLMALGLGLDIWRLAK